MPMGASFATKEAIFISASLIFCNTRMSPSLFRTGISAIPMAILNTTTAGTMVLASDLNGLDGIYSASGSKLACLVIRLLLKKDAEVQSG